MVLSTVGMRERIANLRVFDPLASLSCRSRHGEVGQVSCAWKHSDVVDYNGVEIEVGKREVHNLLILCSEVMGSMTVAKRRLFLPVEEFYTFYSMSYGKCNH